MDADIWDPREFAFRPLEPSTAELRQPDSKMNIMNRIIENFVAKNKDLSQMAGFSHRVQNGFFRTQVTEVNFMAQEKIPDSFEYTLPMSFKRSEAFCIYEENFLFGPVLDVVVCKFGINSLWGIAVKVKAHESPWEDVYSWVHVSCLNKALCHLENRQAMEIQIQAETRVPEEPPPPP